MDNTLLVKSHFVLQKSLTYPLVSSQALATLTLNTGQAGDKRRASARSNSAPPVSGHWGEVWYDDKAMLIPSAKRCFRNPEGAL